MISLLLGLVTLGLATLGVILTVLWIRFQKYQQIINRIPGPPTIPLMGNAHQIGTDSTNFYRIIMEWAETYRSEGVYRFWLGFRPIITVYNADLLSSVMGNTTNTKKSIFYRFLYPWLREGLLLSYGQKWQKRRRMLTPAFHYTILEDFMSVFQQQSQKMIRVLQEKASDQEFDICPHIANNALDIMCNTTMGIDVNAQEHKTPYVSAVYRISCIILERVGRPWTYNEPIFRMTSLGREHYRMLDILHGFSRKVIEDRWKQCKAREGSGSDKLTEAGGEKDLGSQEGLGVTEKKKRLAFLDLLLESARADPCLTLSDIQEEVDTFMFAGHDTTSASISWAVYNLGRHQDWQERLRAEVENCLGLKTEKDEEEEEDEAVLSQQEVSELKLLDCFMKESMRLFTPVPAVSRELLESCKIGRYECPKGSTIQILMSALHRDPQYFPDPNRFDPERWMRDDIIKQNPFCYIPFSAGTRNCMGQKFAQMEMKVVLICLLRHFRIHCEHNHDEFSRQDGELVLRPSGGLLVKLEKLNKNNHY